MDLALIPRFLNGFLMVAIPLGLAVFLTRRWRGGWRLWLIGAATFILSQVGHIPFNAVMSDLLNRTPLATLSPEGQLLFSAAFLGLSAGLFEELFRYGMYRWWAKDARSWRAGVLAGAGHGGAEAILLGALVFYGFLQLVALRDADLSAYFTGDQLALARQQVSAYWTMSWPLTLLGALERCLTIPVQIAFSVIVLQAFVRRQAVWLWLAVLYHAVIDATAVLSVAWLGVYGAEAVVAVFTVLSLILIFKLRRPEPAALGPASDNIAEPVARPAPPMDSKENLDDTRFA
jgi:uncharacterized membrane protein YhfC